MSASASAAISYLRPNNDIALGPWSVVGATSGWASLDDNVLPTETPTAADYVTTSASGRLEVGLESASLAGASGVEPSAWFYTPSSDGVRMEIRTGRGDLLAKADVKSAGWHSAEFEKPVTQADLDSAFMRFERIGGSLPKVYAAFLRLSQSPSAAKVYWGARMDGEVATLERDAFGNPLPIRGDAPWETETWNRFEAHAGRPVSIVHLGAEPRWIEPFQPTPLNMTKARGAIPLISMGSNGATLAELEKGGAKEPAMKTWAKEVAAYEKPFFLRWDWEMNLKSSTKFPWVNEARANPASFVRAWRNIHDIADSEGATNITWVWCPNVSYPESTALSSLYPGNAYVDGTCIDGYNRGTKSGGSWTSFYNLFAGTYAELTSLSFEGRAKPIMVGETASTESGGSKPEWIAEALGTTLPKQFPAIKALVWFNWNITEEGAQWDWPIESPVTTPTTPSASTVSFANAIASPYYAGNSFENLPLLTRIQPLP
jgi:hypothetical protein